MWLLLAFVAVPLIEIALFIQIGGWLTLWPTLGIVLLTGIIGTLLVRQQGFQVLQSLRASDGAMGNPLSPLAHGALILFAGALLLTPGFFTDAVGFLLLVPRLRAWVISQIARRVQVQSFGFRDTRASATRSDRATVIDGEFYELDPQDGPTTPGSTKGKSGWTQH